MMAKIAMSTSRIWQLWEPIFTPYAKCGLRSPPRLTHTPCPRCTLGATYDLPPPLAIEWEVGSDKIGDFVWPGTWRAAVVTRVIDYLAERVPMIKAGEVEMCTDEVKALLESASFTNLDFLECGDIV